MLQLLQLLQFSKGFTTPLILHLYLYIYIFIYIYKYRTISRTCTIIFGTATTATTATDSTNLNYNVIFIVLNKRLNEQVKRNIERFPDDFMFQLTKEEWNILRSQIATANTPENKAIAFLRSQFATTKNLSKIRTLPYAFTRNGIGMLSSVLGSETAVAMNIRIMRAFTASQQIMESNAILFKREAVRCCLRSV